jgi:hypothetical protein
MRQWPKRALPTTRSRNPYRCCAAVVPLTEIAFDNYLLSKPLHR